MMSGKWLGLYGHMFGRRDLITKKLYLVIAVFAVIVFCLVALSYFQASVIDSTRAYVGGEGLWSKGQKDAVLHLEHYAENHEPEEYALFLKGLDVSFGDREARVAMQSVPPDLERARKGFLKGRNHPDDIDGIINLFLYFHEVDHMKKVIELWTEGDAMIDRLMALGSDIDAEIKSETPDREHIRQLIAEVDTLNREVSELEDRFSATLGDVARWASDLTMKLMLATMLLLLAIGTALSRQIVRGIRYTQTELAASEARLRHVVESNMIGIQFWESDGAIFDANDLFLKIIGYTRNELEQGAINWLTLTPDEFREPDRKAMQQVFAKGFCEPYEKEFLHKRGHRVPVLVGAAQFNDSDQTGVCFVLDISERKRAERAQQLAATVFQSAKEAIFMTDARPIIKAVNPAFLEITGYSEEEVMGKNPSVLSSGLHDTLFYETMWHSLKENGSWSGEIINRRKNGELFHEWLSISGIRNGSGKIVEYVGIFTDVTEERKMEEQLRHSQKMEAIGTLVGGIAHDFNNSLAAIKGNAYLASRQCTDAGITERLQTIDILIDHSAEMVRQLMTFARKDIVHKAPLSLNELIRSHERLTRSLMPENIDMSLQLCEEDLWVNGDTTQLQQVLLNLLNNARDAVESCDTPQIRFTMDYLEPDARFIKKHPALNSRQLAHIQVSDNGCGMSDQELAHIFEPFFTTKEVGKGTGLGMSMVYGSIQTHKGEIDIDSKAGKGTTVHIYLPVKAKLRKEAETAESKAATGDNLADRRFTILLVDDNISIRTVCSESLNNTGHHVLSAGDGIEALEVFKANSDRIQLVVSDIVMPRLGGFGLAEQIRALKSDMPVIFMTGYDPQLANVPESLKNNSVIITKPFSMEELQHRMETLLIP